MSIISTAGSGHANGQQNKEVRHLPYQEYLRRREEGKCFRCGQNFGPMHKCPERNLRILILGEEDEPATDDPEFVMVEAEEDGGGKIGKVEAECTLLELPLYLVAGISGQQTQKILGNVKNISAVIMVDSGASHNFISRDFCERVGLESTNSVNFKVKLGDGRRKDSHGCCWGLKVQMGNIIIRTDFHLFDLSGVDVILGVAWLETLGKVKIDWKEQYMSFYQDGQKVKLRGEPSLGRTSLSVKAMLKTIEVDFSGVLWVRSTGDGGETSITEGEEGEGEFGWMMKGELPLEPLEGLVDTQRDEM